MTINPSSRSQNKSAKNCAAIQKRDCSMAYCVECDAEHSPSSKQVAMALNLDDYKSHQADHRINLPRILQQFKDENV